MMKVALIVFSIVIVLSSVNCASVSRASGQKYKAIAVLIRHGDRNAIPKYPNVANDWHFIRTGDLTPEGCTRMYRHGAILSEKYPEIKERGSTELRSASVPSPLVADSIDCLMYGINGPVAHLADLPQDHVYVPKTKGEDTMLNFGRVDCPLREETLQKNKTFLALYDKHKELIDRLNNGTGEHLNSSNLMTIIKGRLEPILNAHEVALPIPDWADEWFRRDSHLLADEEFDFMVNFEFQRALSGVFFKELISRFKKAPENSLSFFAFSSVHTTMGPLMKTIDVWTGYRPAYGEALIFTLDKNDQFGVNYLMSSGDIKQYAPAGCQLNNCTLDQFELSVKRYTELDWEEECKKPFDDEQNA